MLSLSHSFAFYIYIYMTYFKLMIVKGIKSMSNFRFLFGCMCMICVVCGYHVYMLLLYAHMYVEVWTIAHAPRGRYRCPDLLLTSLFPWEQGVSWNFEPVSHRNPPVSSLHNTGLQTAIQLHSTFYIDSGDLNSGFCLTCFPNSRVNFFFLRKEQSFPLLH